MTLKDYSGLLLTFANKVDSIWNYFFTANAAIIIWLTSVENDILLEYRIFATVIYCFYMFIILISHLRAYRFLNLSLNEFKLNIKDSTIPQEIKQLSYSNRHYMIIISYLTVVLFLIYILWTDGYKVL